MTTVVYQCERWEVLGGNRESHLIDLKISHINHTIRIKNLSNGKEKDVSVCDVRFDFEN